MGGGQKAQKETQPLVRMVLNLAKGQRAVPMSRYKWWW